MRPDQQVGLGVGIVSAVGLDCLEAMSAQGLLDGVEQLHSAGGTDEALECLVRQDLRTWQFWMSVRRLGSASPWVLRAALTLDGYTAPPTA
jgi:hypothetical protein